MEPVELPAREAGEGSGEHRTREQEALQKSLSPKDSTVIQPDALIGLANEIQDLHGSIDKAAGLIEKGHDNGFASVDGSRVRGLSPAVSFLLGSRSSTIRVFLRLSFPVRVLGPRLSHSSSLRSAEFRLFPELCAASSLSALRDR